MLAMADPAGHPPVDQNGTAVMYVKTAAAPGPKARIMLHHYVLKSKEEYAHKVERQSPDGTGKTWGFFAGVDRGCTSTCTDAVAIAEVCRLPEIMRAQRELEAQGRWKR